AGDDADALLIVDDEDGSGAAPGLGPLVLARFVAADLFFRARDQDFEGRAAADFAVEIDGAVMTPDDPQHGGQPQAAPCEFGGEEGIENALLGLLVDAATGVGNLQEHVTPLGQLFVEVEFGQVVVGHLACAGPYRDRAGVIADSLRRVGDQVHYYLLHLDGVGFDRRRALVELGHEGDLLGDRYAQQVAHLLHQPA